MKYQNILIINDGIDAHVLMSTPLIRVLKSKFPEADLRFCLSEKYGYLLEENPYLEQVVAIEEFGKKSEEHSYSSTCDLVVDLHPTSRTKKILKRFSCLKLIHQHRRLDYWLLVNFKINLLSKVHLVDRYVSLVHPLEISMDNLGLDFFIPDKDEVELNWLPETHQKEFVVVAISGSHPTRQLPVERLIEACDKINKPIVLVGTQEDETEAQQVVDFFKKIELNAPYEKGLKELNKKTVIFNGCGRFNAHQIGSLIKKSRALVTYDNIWMHVGAALGKDMFCIWGNTMPEFGMYPYRTRFTVLENTAITCRPCTVNGVSSCPVKHFRCMKDLALDIYLP